MTAPLDLPVVQPTLPPEPPSTAPAVDVAAWWQRCDVALRLANFSVAQDSVAAQNARADAEKLVAQAGLAAAQAQQTAATVLGQPVPPPTDAELLLRFMQEQLAAGKVGASVMTEAKAQLAAFKAATARPPSAPL